MRAERAIVFPKAFVIVADLRPVEIDGAALAFQAMFAKLAGWFGEFFDFEHLAAKAAFGAGFSGNRHHLNHAWQIGAEKNRLQGIINAAFARASVKTRYALLSFYI